MASLPAQLHFSEPKLLKVAPANSNGSSQLVVENSVVLHHANPYSASDDEIPSVDYSLLFSDDHGQRLLALEHLKYACENFGFFYLVNHTVPDRVIDNVLKGISDFFDSLTLDEKRMYKTKDPSDRIRWDQACNLVENRECLKVILHPHYQGPAKPSGFSKSLEEYCKGMRAVEDGLAKSMSKTLGLEENYIEKAINLKSGFDVMHINRYPPNSITNEAVGLAEHIDPGFLVTLVQDVDGGLQILPHKGKWINSHIPHHAILIQLADQLEILTNGKYKSHFHRVIIDNNRVHRTSVAILHGPSMDKFISPGKEFVDDEHPEGYGGMTYKEYLEANEHEPINVTSSLGDLRLAKF